MEFGLGQGLAQDLGYNDRINDLRYRADIAARTQAINEAKQKMFADDINYSNASNSFDNKKIRDYAQGQIKKIGAFVRENPDLPTNFDKRLQLNEMKRALKDNPLIHTGMASDAAFKQLNDDLAEVAKNPQQHNTKAYQDLLRQKQNYLQFGHQYGKEAADTQGHQAFVYNKPRDFIDFNKAFQEAGNHFQDLERKSMKGGRNAFEMVPKDESLTAVAQQMYAQNREQVDASAHQANMSPIDFVKQGIAAYIKKDFNFGDYSLSDTILLQKRKEAEKALGAGNPDSAFQDNLVNQKEGVVAPEALEQTYGTTPKHQIYDNSGHPIDNTGNRVHFTGYHKWVETKKGRQKLAEIYTYLPLSVAQEKGIVEDPFGWSGTGKTDLEVSPTWNKQAQIETTENSKGDPEQRVKVKAFMPIALNSYYAGRFNQEAHIAKSKLMAERPDESGGSVPTASASAWKQAGWSDAQIQEGVNSGKIAVR